jgi:hypothetical protein
MSASRHLSITHRAVNEYERKNGKLINSMIFYITNNEFPVKFSIDVTLVS